MSKPVYDDNKCFWCKKPYTTATCTQETIVIDGQRYDRIRYGYEVYRYEGADEVAEKYKKPDRCHDCGVELRQFHHFCCDHEQCPKCRGQLLSCRCSEVAI